MLLFRPLLTGGLDFLQSSFRNVYLLVLQFEGSALNYKSQTVQSLRSSDLTH